MDGETNASIAFNPPMAAGIGFGDTQAPRGNKWVGMGAGNGGNGQAYFVNIMIPFTKTIVITIQRPSGDSGAFYMVRSLSLPTGSFAFQWPCFISQIVRGALNKPINIGGVTVPSNAKLLLQVVTHIFSND